MNLLNSLKQFLPEEQISQSETVLDLHSRDESQHPPHRPDIVVFPKSKDEISAILKWAHEHHMPVVPFGAGSSLEGHVIPYHGGISIDTSLMNSILEVRPHDFLVKVQPGVTRLQLNKELKKYGLFFPVDPGADATLGGMAATNASGTMAVRYGIMRDQVRDLEVVLADGRIIHTGGLSAKSSSGYHLNGLFVGSEGTLGVFSEITLKVYGIPEVIMAARASFPTIKDAVDAATAMLSAAIPIARTELVDARSIRQPNLHIGTNYPESATLFLEFHGNESGLTQGIEFAGQIMTEYDCTSFEHETDSLKRAQLWEARHNLSYAFRHGYPGKKLIGTDVCVPISELAGAVEFSRDIIRESGLDGAVFGHIGDGNFHSLIIIDPNSPSDVEHADRINQAVVEYALERGGTCTGEHGVGVGKIKYQRKEHGDALDVMISIKRLLDPENIPQSWKGASYRIEDKKAVHLDSPTRLINQIDPA